MKINTKQIKDIYRLQYIAAVLVNDTLVVGGTGNYGDNIPTSSIGNTEESMDVCVCVVDRNTHVKLLPMVVKNTEHTLYICNRSTTPVELSIENGNDNIHEVRCANIGNTLYIDPDLFMKIKIITLTNPIIDERTNNIYFEQNLFKNEPIGAFVKDPITFVEIMQDGFNKI